MTKAKTDLNTGDRAVAPETADDFCRRTIFTGAVAALLVATAPPVAEASAGQDSPATAHDYAAMRFGPDANAAKVFEKLGTREEWMQHAEHDWFLMQIALKSTSTMDDQATRQMVSELGADVVMEAVENFHRMHNRHAAIAAVAESANIRHMAGVCRFAVAEGLL